MYAILYLVFSSTIPSCPMLDFAGRFFFLFQNPLPSPNTNTIVSLFLVYYYSMMFEHREFYFSYAVGGAVWRCLASQSSEEISHSWRMAWSWIQRKTMVWLANVTEKIPRTLCDQHKVQGTGNAGVCVPGLSAFITSRSIKEFFHWTSHLRCDEVETWHFF